MAALTSAERSSMKGERRHVVAAAITSCFGWSLDLFDLFILLYVAPVIGKLFFPSGSTTLSLAAVYASFAVTLLMRPVGAAIFGHYADRHGRRSVMIFAVNGVGITTALFGALPTLQQVGPAGPIMFLLLRLIQGIFVGGVVATTHTVGIEFMPPRWRGVLSGLIGGGGAGFGALLASLAFLIASSVASGPSFESWGWRLMFFSGLTSSFLGLYAFRALEESPLWLELRETKSRVRKAETSPLRDLFGKAYRGTAVVNLLITIGAGSIYYVTSGYLPAFLKVVNRIPNTTISMILIGGAVVAIISGPAVGFISDKIGRKATFLAIGAANVVLTPLFFFELSEASSFGAAAAYAFGISFLGNAILAPIPIFLNERFPTAMRATGTGLCWNVGFAIGGVTPTLVSLASTTVSGIPLSLASFAIGASVIFLAGSIIIPETRGNLDKGDGAFRDRGR